MDHVCPKVYLINLASEISAHSREFNRSKIEPIATDGCTLMMLLPVVRSAHALAIRCKYLPGARRHDCITAICLYVYSIQIAMLGLEADLEKNRVPSIPTCAP